MTQGLLLPKRTHIQDRRMEPIAAVPVAARAHRVPIRTREFTGTKGRNATATVINRVCQKYVRQTIAVAPEYTKLVV